MDERQKQDGLCQQVEDDVESPFDEESWGANNNLVREKVKQVPIEHALINDPKPKKKTPKKDKKKGLKYSQEHLLYCYKSKENMFILIYNLYISCI